MPRKYINRERKRSNKVSDDDEWAHITGIEKGPELEIEDAMDVQERTIALKKEHANKTPYEIIKEESRNAMPPMLGTKIIPIGQINAISWESWPAPLGIYLYVNPNDLADWPIFFLDRLISHCWLYRNLLFKRNLGACRCCNS